MEKFKGTIYLPIGLHNSNLNNEVKIVRLVHKNLPRELRISSIMDTYIDEKYSACTVELEKLETQQIDKNKDSMKATLDFVKDKIDVISKNSKLKSELKEVYDFIAKFDNIDS